MTIGYEFWEKGICVPTRGATARGGVRDQDLNMWEGGESSGDNVGDRSAGSIRRRDRDFGNDSAFGSNRGEKQSETEVWGFRDKGFAGGED